MSVQWESALFVILGIDKGQRQQVFHIPILTQWSFVLMGSKSHNWIISQSLCLAIIEHYLHDHNLYYVDKPKPKRNVWMSFNASVKWMYMSD